MPVSKWREIVGDEVLDGQVGLEENDILTPDEVFEIVLDWEGIIGYASWIRRLVKRVYGVTLGECYGRGF